MSRIARCVAPALIMMLLITPVIAAKYDGIDVNTIIDHSTKLEKGENIFFKPKSDTNSFSIDICVYSLKTGKINVVSSDKDGNVGDKMSNHYSSKSDGTKVVFQSWSTNFNLDKSSGTSVYVKDTTTNILTKISPYAFSPTISPDGNYVVYEYNQNVKDNIPPWLVLYEIETGKLTNIAPTSGGNSFGYTIQTFRFEGNLVIFNSSAPQLHNYKKTGFVTYSYDIVTKELKEYVQ